MDDERRRRISAGIARGYYVYQGRILSVAVPDYWVQAGYAKVEPEVVGDREARKRFGSDFAQGEWWALEMAKNLEGEEITKCLGEYYSD